MNLIHHYQIRDLQRLTELISFLEAEVFPFISGGCNRWHIIRHNWDVTQISTLMFLVNWLQIKRGHFISSQILYASSDHLWPCTLYLVLYVSVSSNTKKRLWIIHFWLWETKKNFMSPCRDISWTQGKAFRKRHEKLTWTQIWPKCDHSNTKLPEQWLIFITKMQNAERDTNPTNTDQKIWLNETQNQKYRTQSKT